MTKKSILVCVEPTDGCWQLGPLPPATGRVALVGWQVSPAPVDSGVPVDIAAALARSLTSVACVTFPATRFRLTAAARESSMPDTVVRTLAPSAGPQGLKDRAEAILKRQALRVDLVSPRDPEVALALFDDSGYPWCLQGQVALLSAPHSAPPPLDRETLFGAFADGWQQNAERLRAAGIVGLLVPGVDGDVAGIFTFAADTGQALVDALRREAGAAGFGWFVLPENEFMQSLAGEQG